MKNPPLVGPCSDDVVLSVSLLDFELLLSLVSSSKRFFAMSVIVVGVADPAVDDVVVELPAGGLRRHKVGHRGRALHCPANQNRCSQSGWRWPSVHLYADGEQPVAGTGGDTGTEIAGNYQEF